MKNDDSINKRLNICVVGAGYVGMSISVLLADKHKVVLVDVNKAKVECINQRISPIKDDLIEEYLYNHHLNLTATVSINDACIDADYVFIATPTNYNELTNSFDTSTVELCINQILMCNKKLLLSLNLLFRWGLLVELAMRSILIGLSFRQSSYVNRMHCMIIYILAV